MNLRPCEEQEQPRQPAALRGQHCAANPGRRSIPARQPKMELRRRRLPLCTPGRLASKQVAAADS